MSGQPTNLRALWRQVNRTPGFEAVTGSGGVQVSAGKRSVTIADTRAPVQYALGILRSNLGWTPALYHAARKADQQRRLQAAMADTEPSGPSPDPPPDAAPARPASLRRVAAAKGPTATVDAVLADLDTAALQVWEAVLADAQTTGRRAEMRGQDGWIWRGDLYSLLRGLWPHIPDTRGHADAIRLQTHLVPHLRDAAIMRTMRAAGPAVRAIWWVAATQTAEPAEPAEPDAEPTAGTTADPAKDTPMTPPPVPAPTSATGPAPADLAPADLASPPPAVMVTCNLATDVDGQACPFKDTGEAVQSHIGKLGGRPHPYEATIPCEEDGCRVVRTSAASYAQHLTRGHGLTGLFICRRPTCLHRFTSRGDLIRHAKEDHPAPADAPADTPAAQEHETTHDTPAGAAGPAGVSVEEMNAAIDAAPPVDAAAMTAAITEMVTGYGPLKADHARLAAAVADRDARIALLTADNAHLRALLDRVNGVSVDYAIHTAQPAAGSPSSSG